MNAAFFEQLNKPQQSFLRLLATKDEDADTRLSTLAHEMNFASESGLRYHLATLEASALIKWPQLGRGNPKIVRLTSKGRELLEANPPTLMVYEGGVHAGFCGVGYEADVLEIQKLEHLLALYGANYAVKIKGDCMNGGPNPIRSGDRVLCRHETPRNGKIVHFEMPITVGESEPLLREYSIDEESNIVTLKCYNPAPHEAAEMSYDSLEVDVRGVVVTILHDI